MQTFVSVPFQEGAAFISFKIVENGTFKEKELIEALNAPGKVPGISFYCLVCRNFNQFLGCSGTRNLSEFFWYSFL